MPCTRYNWRFSKMTFVVLFPVERTTATIYFLKFSYHSGRVFNAFHAAHARYIRRKECFLLRTMKWIVFLCVGMKTLNTKREIRGALMFLALENKLYFVFKGLIFRRYTMRGPHTPVFCITPRSSQHCKFVVYLKQCKMLFLSLSNVSLSIVPSMNFSLGSTQNVGYSLLHPPIKNASNALSGKSWWPSDKIQGFVWLRVKINCPSQFFHF